jgi:hypothetical protein
LPEEVVFLSLGYHLAHYDFTQGKLHYTGIHFQQNGLFFFNESLNNTAAGTAITTTIKATKTTPSLFGDTPPQEGNKKGGKS